MSQYGQDVAKLSHKIGEFIKDEPTVLVIPALTVLVAAAIGGMSDDKEERDVVLLSTIDLMKNVLGMDIYKDADQTLQ